MANGQRQSVDFLCKEYGEGKDDVESNLLEKGQSQYEAGNEESKEKEGEKETSPSDPAAALKSDIDPV